MRRIVWSLVAVVVGVGLVGGVLLVRDARAVERELASARRSLQVGARSLVEDPGGARARQAFDAAGRAAQDVQVRLDGPLWRSVSNVPHVGPSVALADAAAGLAASAAQLGTQVSDRAGDLLRNGPLDGIVADGKVDLTGLDQFLDLLTTLPTGPVAQARAQLEAIPPGDVLARLRDDRREAIAQATDVLDRVDRIEEGLKAARAFVGGDGPRTYLLAAQNPAELRGTGGLIGFLGELRFTGGTVALGTDTSSGADALTRRPEIDRPNDLPVPVDRPAAFARRYDHIAAGRFLGSVNADPDLPTVAPVLLNLYAQEVGPDLDGAIMVDPVGLGMIVQATGRPLQLPAGVDTAGLPRRFPGNRIPSLVMVEGYDAFGGGGATPKQDFDKAIITAGLEQFTGGGWDPVKMGRALAAAFATRHLQLYARDDGVEASFEALGLGGRMTPTDRGGDVLAVTGVNAAANKSDVHVAHRMRATLQLDVPSSSPPAVVQRAGTVTVEVDNPLRPGDHDPYITGSNTPQVMGQSRSRRTDDGLNRTWFSIWAPGATQPVELREGDQQRAVPFSDIHGHRVFDYYLDTPAVSTNAFTFDYDGPVQLRRDGGDFIYQLTLWRQAKAIPDQWDLAVSAPGGWHIQDASLDGGGAPVGMGVDGQDGEQVRLSVAADTARVVGAVTQDVTLTLRLSPG